MHVVNIKSWHIDSVRMESMTSTMRIVLQDIIKNETEQGISNAADILETHLRCL